MNNKKVHKIMNKLFQVHEIYRDLKNNADRIAVFEKVEPLLVQMDEQGIDRGFSETFLIYGNEFLRFEYGLEWKLKNSA